MTPFQLPASLGIIAEKLNPGLAQAGFISKQAYFTQRALEYAGSSQKGSMLQGTSIPWDDATQVQLMVVQTAQEAGVPVPDQAALMSPDVAGPEDPFNLPYRNNGWGFGGGSPASVLKTATVGVSHADGSVQIVTGTVL